jgi:hypothetical protein
MPQLNFTTSFTKNDNLLFSAQEIKSSYLYGIKMNSSLAVQKSLEFSDEDIEFHVRAAQKEMENYLSLKLFRQLYNESQSFDNGDWRHWGFIKTTYQVVCPMKMEGFLNSIKQTEYPREWMSAKRDSDGIQYHRSIYIVPAGNTGAIVNSIQYAGLLPNLGYLNAGMIPNYWEIYYVTGFEKVPNDLMMTIGQLATMSLLSIAGSNVLGIPGAMSTSLSIDGLSQAISASSNAFGERVKALGEDLARRLPTLIGTYRGFSWGVA